MRYAFEYPNSANLGDDIQTLAALQFMGEDVTFVPRDQLRLVIGQGQVLLNGWWSHDPSTAFPPTVDALPISMHLSQKFRDEVTDLSWFAGRRVYARDIDTTDWLLSKGVDAVFSGCLTLTFPKVTCERKTKFLFVDSRHITGSCCSSMLTQIAPSNPLLSGEARRKESRRLLSLYPLAEMVFTSRLHCALPCAAMGVPVVCIVQEKDIRFTGMERFITLCTDGKINAAIDKEKQTRSERQAHIDAAAGYMRGVIANWLQPKEDGDHAQPQLA